MTNAGATGISKKGCSMETEEKMVVRRTWVSGWHVITNEAPSKERWAQCWEKLFAKAANLRYASMKEYTTAIFGQHLPDNKGKIIRWVCEELVKEQPEEDIDTFSDKEPE